MVARKIPALNNCRAWGLASATVSPAARRQHRPEVDKRCGSCALLWPDERHATSPAGNSKYGHLLDRPEFINEQPLGR